MSKFRLDKKLDSQELTQLEELLLSETNLEEELNSKKQALIYYVSQLMLNRVEDDLKNVLDSEFIQKMTSFNLTGEMFGLYDAENRYQFTYTHYPSNPNFGGITEGVQVRLSQSFYFPTGMNIPNLRMFEQINTFIQSLSEDEMSILYKYYLDYIEALHSKSVYPGSSFRDRDGKLNIITWGDLKKANESWYKKLYEFINNADRETNSSNESLEEKLISLRNYYSDFIK